MTGITRTEVELLIKFALLAMLSAVSVRGLGDSRTVVGAFDREEIEFVDLMEHVEGILVRIPINTSNEENSDLAEIKILTSFVDVGNPNIIPSIWASAVALEEYSLSSTSNWHHWFGQGLARAEYFLNFRPNFRAGGTAWHYGTPQYVTILDADGLYRNYYHYPRTLYW